MKTRLLKNKKGYSVLELIFYISFFAILVLLVINSMLTMSRSFKETAIYADLNQGSFVMERISREVRQADSVSSISNTNLRLNTSYGGTAKTVEFIISGTDMQFWDDGVLVGNLNSDSINIENVSFTSILTSAGSAVRVVFSLRSDKDASGRVEYFYNTIVLRGDY